MDLSREELLKLYKTMATIRRFEERALYEVGARGISGAVHSSAGEEAGATGVISQLRTDDYIASTHRGHGHSIAKGVDPKQMMAEILGRVTGTNKGKGGSMHIADMSTGMLGATGIVAASVPIAVGAALSAKTRGTDQVAVAFFGDGGANQGVVHESMNLGSIWKLPVIFVCENNLYAESTPVEYALSVENVADRAAAYSMPGVTIDGQDVLAVHEAAKEAIERARSGGGPTLLELRTYRYRGHTAFDNPLTYRTKEEEAYWHDRDPLIIFRERATREELVPIEDLDAADKAADDLIEESVKFSDESPEPDPEELYNNVYVEYPREQFTLGAGYPAE
jgi:pyruvate dehydrogenase E1 component alpha subunit